MRIKHAVSLLKLGRRAGKLARFNNMNIFEGAYCVGCKDIRPFTTKTDESNVGLYCADCDYPILKFYKLPTLSISELETLFKQ